jgi:hypothetical protein
MVLLTKRRLDLFLQKPFNNLYRKEDLANINEEKYTGKI